jgi:hypothetical protein
MTSHDAPPSTATLDHLPSVLSALSVLAATVLLAHPEEAGVCTQCGSAWPCERATMAEHNLALL